MSANFEVFGSDYTLDTLGFITDYVPDLAQRNTLILSHKDLLGSDAEIINRRKPYDEVDLKTAIDTGKEKLTEILDEYEAKGIMSYPDEYYIKTSELDVWGKPKIELTTDPALVKDAVINDITSHVVTGEAAAFGSHLAGKGSQVIGIITTPDMDEPFNLTYFPDDTFVNDIGITESNAWIVWHEAAHIGDPHLHPDDHKNVHGETHHPDDHKNVHGETHHSDDYKTIHVETHADTHAARTVPQAIADGHGDLIGFDLASRIYAQRMVASFTAPGNDDDFDLHLNNVAPELNSDKIGLGPKIAFDYQISKPTHTTHIFQNAANPIQQAQMKTEMVSGNTDLNIYLARNELFQGIEGLDGDNLRAFVKYKLMNDGDLLLDLADIGTEVSKTYPIKSMAMAHVLMEEGIVLPGSPQANYFNDVSKFFEDRGDLLTSDPRYLEAKDTLQQNLQLFDITQDVPPNIQRVMNSVAVDNAVFDVKKAVRDHLFRIDGIAGMIKNSEAHALTNTISEENKHLDPYTTYDGLSPQGAKDTLSQIESLVQQVDQVVRDHPDVEEKYNSISLKHNLTSVSEQRADIDKLFEKAREKINVLEGPAASNDEVYNQKPAYDLAQ